MPAGHILVVDDEWSIRSALRSTLAALGYDVAEAATGEDAVAQVQRRAFDAVLLDINMPGVGGAAACAEIRRIHPTLPIVMLSVRDTEDDKVQALEAGADDYVTKPFSVREL